MGAKCHDKLQIEVTTCPTCRYPYQNQVPIPCAQCYPTKGGRNASPKIISKINHRSPTSGCTNTMASATFNGAYDIPPAHSKLRHLQQRARKHTSSLGGGSGSSGSIIGLETCEKSSALVAVPSPSPPLSCCNPSPKKEATSGERDRGSGFGNHSPTSSLSFVIPLPATISIYTLGKADQRLSESIYSSDDDLQIISQSQKYLKMCGWYHPHLSWTLAFQTLMPTPVGTFLIRDSSDVHHLYSLSVQTKCGPTSIRIHYSRGKFRLAANCGEEQHMPTFPCIMKLVQYYVDHTKKLPMECWPDGIENLNCENILGSMRSSIVLEKPQYTDGYFPSLKHLSRLCINRHVKDPNLLSVLPASSFVIDYLLEYPFKL